MPAKGRDLMGATGRARIRVSTPLILQALAFPEGTKLVACHTEHVASDGYVEFVLDHRDLPLLIEGQAAPVIVPVFTQVGPRPETWIKVDWNINAALTSSEERVATLAELDVELRGE